MQIRKLLYLVFSLYSSHIYSSITDYIYPYNSHPSFSNYGGLGLIQMPNARFLEEGSIGISWSDIEPYQRGSIVAYPFDWLEASYQYTDINNALYSNVPAFSGDQTYKDKGFDIKLLLFKERRYSPAIAVGLRDFAGTGIFASEYIVASKKIKNIDLSAGIGFGTLSSNGFNNPFTSISDSFKKRTGIGDTQGGEANFGSFFSLVYISSSSFRACISVSGTNFPPYSPKKPSEFGKSVKLSIVKTFYNLIHQSFIFQYE